MNQNRLIIDQKQRIADWVQSRIPDRMTPFIGFYAMGVERDGRIVAGIVLDNFNQQNAFPHIAIDQPGKGLIMLLRAFCDYAFRQCQLKRLTIYVPAYKEDILRFDRHIGFEYEFIMKDAAPEGDMVFLVMRRETCRWLS